MAFGDSDIPFMLQDFGVPVQLGGYSDVGLLDDFEQRDGFGSVDVDVVSRIRKVEVQSGAAVTTAFHRAGPASFSDVNGIVQTAGVDVLRNQHYVAGVLQPPLVELASRNSVLWSRDQSNPAWARANAGSAVRNIVGLDGTANSATTVTDSDGAARTQWTMLVTVPVDSNTHTVAFWIKKDSDVTRFPVLFSQITGGTSIARGTSLNTSTGQIIANNAIGTTTQRIVDGDTVGYAGWWIIEQTLTNNSTAGNVNLTVGFNPAYGTVINVNNVAAQGSMGIGQIQLELNKSAYSSVIFTTNAAVDRAADIDQMFAATPTGYSRQIGSFLTEGFKTGRKIKPVGFVSNPQSVITDVTDLTVTVSDRRAAESAVAGRSLYFGLPGLKRGSALTVDGTALKVRDVMQIGDGALTEIHVVTP